MPCSARTTCNSIEGAAARLWAEPTLHQHHKHPKTSIAVRTIRFTIRGFLSKKRLNIHAQEVGHSTRCAVDVNA